MGEVPRSSLRRSHYVGASFARFSQSQGLGDLAPGGHRVIEAYCAMGLVGRASSTKGTYRSVLRQGADPVLLPRRPGYRGSPARAPYSPAERAELLAITRAQPRGWRGEAAQVVLALAMGAGLRAKEIVAARSGDVCVDGTDVVVRVGDQGAARRVAVEAPFASMVAGCAGRGDIYLFHPGEADRRYHNFVNAITATLVCDPAAPRLSLARCRSSYICDRLRAGTRLAALLTATGIAQVESLLRYCAHVEGAPATKAALRHRLAEEASER